MVAFNIDLFFRASPKGAETDDLKDTVCYLAVVDLVTKHCQSKRFNLIESLAKSVHDKIIDFLSPYKHQLKSVTVELHKVSPPVPNIHGGVKWTHHVNHD